MWQHKLNKFHKALCCLQGCSKLVWWRVVCQGLIVTRSNLVVTWKVRTKMGVISWFPLSNLWLESSLVGCTLVTFATECVQVVLEKKEKRKKVTCEPLEFVKEMVEHVHEFKQIIGQFRGIYSMYYHHIISINHNYHINHNHNNNKWTKWTFNTWVLERFWFQPVSTQFLPIQ